MSATSKDGSQIELAKKLDNVPWCDDYEKMISGMLYNPEDPTLLYARHKARKWCLEYNTTFPSGPEDSPSTLAENRTKMLQSIIGKISNPSKAYIEPPLYLDYGSNVSIGSNFYSNFNLTILDCGLVTIGNNVFFGPNVSIYSATHETGVQSRRDNIEYAKPVEIGDDCWVGGNVVILPGVKIGKGCTVAAGSVVSRSIEDWSVAVGSPARVIKKVEAVE